MTAGNNIDFTVRLKEEGLKDTVKDVGHLSSEFDALANQQSLIQQFAKLKQSTAAAGQAFDNAQAHAQRLGRELAGTEAPTRQQTAAFTQARSAVNSAKDAYQAAQLRLQAMRGTLAENNIETTGLAQKQAALRQGMRALEEQAAANTKRLKELGSSGPKAIADTTQATDRATSSTKEYSGALTQVAGAVASVFAVGKVVDYARSVNDVADQYKNLEARVRLAVGAETDLKTAVEGIGRVAIDTNSNLDATAELYGRLAASAKELNITQAEALGITKTINQSIQVSGASAQASEAAVRQLVQALQSGVLRGDEFNSIMEQSPRLSKALADGLNVPIGALRGMAEQGELTSARVIRALKGQADVINQEFATLPLTTGRALENLNTQWTLFIGKLTGGAQQSSVVAQGINALAQNLDTLAGVAARAGATLTAALAIQGVAALKAFATEMLTTSKAASLLTLELSKIPSVINIAVAVTGFEIGYQIGTMLHENSELARKLGIGITGFMQAIINDLQFLKEAAAAVFTNDTVDAAFDRYIQRGKEMDQVLADMWKDAANAPTTVASAANASASSFAALGAAGTAAGQAVAAGANQGAAGIAQLKSASEDARASLAGLATAINSKPTTATAFTDIVRDLVAAKLRGEELELQLRDKLPQAIEKLSGTELQKFRAEFVRAMDQAKQALQDAINTGKPQAEIAALQAKVDSFARATSTGLQLIAEQAAKNLGVDVPAAFGKVSDGFRQAQENMSVLIRQMPQLKAAGVDTGLVVGQALNNMINGAKNQAEIDAIIQRINILRKELGEKVADGLLDQASIKAKELKQNMQDAVPGIQSVEEAMRRLGITSDQALKDTAKSAKESYDYMVAQGKSSARELGEAFQQAADAAIKANNGIAPSWVKAQASLRGYEIVVDEAGKATLRLKDATDKASEAHGRNARSIDDNRTSLERLNAEREREIAAQEKANQLKERELKLYQEKWNIDAQGFSKNTAGNRIQAMAHTRASVYNQAKQAGLDEKIALQVADSFTYDASGTNASVSAVNKAVNDAILQQARDKVAADDAAKKNAGRTTEASSSTSTSNSGSSHQNSGSSNTGNTYYNTNVHITVDTKKFAPVKTDSSGAKIIEDSLLTTLEKARGVYQG